MSELSGNFGELPEDTSIPLADVPAYIEAQAARIAALKAMVEERERCGNCGHWSDALYLCKLPDEPQRLARECAPSDRCHWPESKWEMCDE